MKSLTCKKCGKVIEGYNDNHVEHLMQQHQLVHKREEKKDEIKKQESQKDQEEST